MSMISGKTELTSASSVLRKYSATSRDKIKTLISKVQFETHVERRVETVLDRVETEGDVQQYERFLTLIKEEDYDDVEYLRIIRESKSCIPRLKPHFRAFVEVITGLNWLSRSPEVHQEYQSFIVDLLVAHNKYTNIVVSRLISFFVPKDDLATSWKHGKPSDEIKSKLETVHNLIHKLLDVIPMMFQILLQQISQWFPYHKKSSFIYGGFIYNLLWLTEYRQIYKEDILHLIVLKLLELDVSISRHEIEDAEDEEEDGEGLDGGAESMSLNASQVMKEFAEDEMRHPLAETLDIGLELIFEYIQKELETLKGNNLKKSEFFAIFMRIFETNILPTHNSHHVQFIIFYLCHFENTFLEILLDKLWFNARDFNLAPALRQASVGYLASILARARFIPFLLLRDFLAQLCDWAHQYIQRSDSVSNNSLKAHTVFYSICQAIFYIIAFRSRELTADKKGLIYLQSLQLSSLVTSHLNPLRVCLPAIATTFAGVTRAHQLAYCHTVLERNARRKLATVYSNDAQTPDECLETFFPFDPYLLKKSGGKIQDLYLQYQADDHHHEQHHDQLNSPEVGQKRQRLESFSTMNEEDDFIGMHEQKKRIRHLSKCFEDEIHLPLNGTVVKP
ncbi:RNA polymerase I-specific transcription initiation factor RRN3 [Culicoides brevitarsis]|uniref:RNA polymerase I-specific transcription initiation factor RRN3 n=1 Tax=Culicoides brevitarsis TaxID=469753 RepID=UPI00307BD457